MEYREFCRNIEWDYMYYLYKYDKRKKMKNNNIGYPYCCHLSANLIASYLTVHFNTNFKHQEFRNPITMHGWTESPNEVIDYTGFQKELSPGAKEQFLDKTNVLSQQEFKNLVECNRNDYPLFQALGDYDFLADHGFGEVNNIELYGIEIARKVADPYDTKAFINYVEEALPIIRNKVQYRTT